MMWCFSTAVHVGLWEQRSRALWGVSDQLLPLPAEVVLNSYNLPNMMVANQEGFNIGNSIS